ncbi:hypothetical protein FB465_7053 [Kitasatospora atroaurantiaca]|uniref:Uncharacterized protein n=1 Tax=Kitasatospora atroaurantiaca TaxID=285545 RepID=A0A561F1T4_9ACTN|nr:hypothetical protein FB465_7053 [Kitasatospora atroaurantiaca]
MASRRTLGTDRPSTPPAPPPKPGQAAPFRMFCSCAAAAPTLEHGPARQAAPCRWWGSSRPPAASPRATPSTSEAATPNAGAWPPSSWAHRWSSSTPPMTRPSRRRRGPSRPMEGWTY